MVIDFEVNGEDGVISQAMATIMLYFMDKMKENVQKHRISGEVKTRSLKMTKLYQVTIILEGLSLVDGTNPYSKTFSS